MKCVRRNINYLTTVQGKTDYINKTIVGGKTKYQTTMWS